MIPYHGQPQASEDEVVRGEAKSGTTHFHGYATVSIVHDKRRYTVGGLAVLGLAAYALLGNGASGSAAVEVQGSPRLKVDRETIDLGDIQLGQTVEARFRLTNVGDQPLRLAEAPYIEVVEGC